MFFLVPEGKLYSFRWCTVTLSSLLHNEYMPYLSKPLRPSVFVTHFCYYYHCSKKIAATIQLSEWVMWSFCRIVKLWGLNFDCGLKFLRTEEGLFEMFAIVCSPTWSVGEALVHSPYQRTYLHATLDHCFHAPRRRHHCHAPTRSARLVERVASEHDIGSPRDKIKVGPARYDDDCEFLFTSSVLCLFSSSWFFKGRTNYI